jgi:membrane associated rhomboid family serine protease
MFRLPKATGWLIAINVVVQLVRGLLPSGLDDSVVDNLGFHSASLHRHFGALDFISLFTYQFLHGGWDHLGLNMVSLLAFGAGVELPIGKGRFLVLYFLSGVGGALLEGVFAPASRDDLMVGASGSISGVFGALMVIWGLYRRGDNPLGFLKMTALWIGLIAVTGIFGVGAPQGTPVAWVAHIGGFIAGMALGYLFRPRPRRV